MMDTKLRRGILRHAYKQTGRAIVDYKMLSDSDNILVAVSGGVDSLSLAVLLYLRAKKIPIKYKLQFCFVNTDIVEIDINAIRVFIEKLGGTLIIKDNVLDGDNNSCFWCAWNRRKKLFETARELGCNKIAFGHNLDDLAETMLLNLLYRGEISTSPPSLDMFGGEIKVIRPLTYLKKSQILEFAANMDIPDIKAICPYDKNSRREFVRNFLNESEKDCDAVKKNILRSLARVKKDYLV
ncbi:MAG: tRNA 2-thiocytidine biosynthesis TtcA family protein [Candidatus Omnitrophota bacterium]|nr:tRNA 2-thiocytidine biosynthesis TtcA family protein [Candidatus Omnitrophota bacterium]